MKKLLSLKVLGQVIFASGVFDLFGGIYFTFLVGTNRSIVDPPTHSFYAILIGAFLFCFGYLLCMTALNVRRYLFNVGVVIVSRVFYAILLFANMFADKNFPTTFLPTAIMDLVWTALYIVIVLSIDEIRFRDLFIPKMGDR